MSNTKKSTLTKLCNHLRDVFDCRWGQLLGNARVKRSVEVGEKPPSGHYSAGASFFHQQGITGYHSYAMRFTATGRHLDYSDPAGNTIEI